MRSPTSSRKQGTGAVGGSRPSDSTSPTARYPGGGGWGCPTRGASRKLGACAKGAVTWEAIQACPPGSIPEGERGRGIQLGQPPLLSPAGASGRQKETTGDLCGLVCQVSAKSRHGIVGGSCGGAAARGACWASCQHGSVRGAEQRPAGHGSCTSPVAVSHCRPAVDGRVY